MRKIKEYLVIPMYSVFRLNDAVNEKIKERFEPHCAIFAFLDQNNDAVYLKTVVKYED
ncbi:hypothetical protein UFOVP733_32 [uncultured Caudovirales phage]|uniref:Uncharacterized protein n=1 Tax=uncultured Caudovirales phage TaxID=2100421 RepID=A0A6J7X315_9CAUD|nr:hypothetical protein UFOVP733_32 [uncultured Caudovirales phage]CAB5224892.1 hypothetical protein UFOVP743_27 [uncultured Caudovirales phage]